MFSSKLTTTDFLLKAREIHGNRYDYSLAEYKNNRTKIKIICPNHGIFEQTSKSHIIQKSGCNKCADTSNGIKKRKSLEHFLTKAKEIHGDRYDYSLVVYNGCQRKVKIICKKHGQFFQNPLNHQQGQGCRKCFNEKMKEIMAGGYTLEFFQNNKEMRDIPAVLYLAKIRIKNDNFYKVGITKHNLKKRFYFKGIHYCSVLKIAEISTTLYNAFIQERALLDKLKSLKFYPNTQFAGYTECFKINEEVDFILQNEFKINIKEALSNAEIVKGKRYLDNHDN